MRNMYLWGVSILAITILIIVAYLLRKQNTFFNLREIVCSYWKMLASFWHRVVFIIMPFSFGLGLALVTPITVSVLETTCTVISILLGAIFIIIGFLKIVDYFTSKDKEDYLLTMALISVIFGVIVLSCSDVIVGVFRIILGIWIIAAGIKNFQQHLYGKKLNQVFGQLQLYVQCL